MNLDWMMAQCVMCYRTAAAQQIERSRVLNSGILILLIPPILVLAGILLLAFRKSASESIKMASTSQDGSYEATQSLPPMDLQG
jgi:hypothetical protein